MTDKLIFKEGYPLVLKTITKGTKNYIDGVAGALSLYKIKYLIFFEINKSYVFQNDQIY